MSDSTPVDSRIIGNANYPRMGRRIAFSFLTLLLFGALTAAGGMLVRRRMEYIAGRPPTQPPATPGSPAVVEKVEKDDARNSGRETAAGKEVIHETVETVTPESLDPGLPFLTEALQAQKRLEIDHALELLETAGKKAEGAGLAKRINEELRKTRSFKKVLDLFRGDELEHAVLAADPKSDAVFVSFRYGNRDAMGLVLGDMDDPSVQVSVVFADRPALRSVLRLPLYSKGIKFHRVGKDYVRKVFENAYQAVAETALPQASSAAGLYDLIVLANRLKLKLHLHDLLETAYAMDRNIEDIFSREMVSRGIDKAMECNYRNEDAQADEVLDELKTRFVSDLPITRALQETEEFLADMRRKRAKGYVSTIKITRAPAPSPASPATEIAASPPESAPPAQGSPAAAEPVAPAAPVSARAATDVVGEIVAEDMAGTTIATKQELVDKADEHFQAGLKQYRKWKNNWGHANKVLKAAGVEFDKAVDLYQQAAEEEANPELRLFLFSRATDANMLLYACHKHTTLNMTGLSK